MTMSFSPNDCLLELRLGILGEPPGRVDVCGEVGSTGETGFCDSGFGGKGSLCGMMRWPGVSELRRGFSAKSSSPAAAEMVIGGAAGKAGLDSSILATGSLLFVGSSVALFGSWTVV